jgi:hypothetical protein
MREGFYVVFDDGKKIFIDCRVQQIKHLEFVEAESKPNAQPPRKQKIQIIGAIGKASSKEKMLFGKAESKLISMGFDVFNPLYLNGNAYECMLQCVDNLILWSDAICILDTATKSAGGCREMLIANNLAKKLDTYYFNGKEIRKIRNPNGVYNSVLEAVRVIHNRYV